MQIQRTYFHGKRVTIDDIILQLLAVFEAFRIWKKRDVTYPPTHTWGTGLCGGTKAKPQPQPRKYPCIYPGVLATRANPYEALVHIHESVWCVSPVTSWWYCSSSQRGIPLSSSISKFSMAEALAALTCSSSSIPGWPFQNRRAFLSWSPLIMLPSSSTHSTSSQGPSPHNMYFASWEAQYLAACSWALSWTLLITDLEHRPSFCLWTFSFLNMIILLLLTRCGKWCPRHCNTVKSKFDPWLGNMTGL